MTTGSYVRYGPPVGVDCCGNGSFPISYIGKNWSGDDRKPGEAKGTPHNYLCTYQKRTYGKVRHVIAGECLIATCWGSATGSGYTWTDNDQLKLLSKLSTKIRGESMSPSVFLGTLHQSASLIANRATAIRYGIMAATLGLSKKRVLSALAGSFDPRRVRRSKKRLTFQQESLLPETPALKSVSNLWLEISYGWMPLLSDVHDICGVMAKAADGHYSKRYVVSHQALGNPLNSPSVNYVDIDSTTYVRRKLIYDVEPLVSFSDLLAVYGLNDPASIVWELTPWSFVIDWFLPVGSYLDAMALYPHLRGKWVQSTKSVAKATLTGKSFGGYTPVSPQNEEWGWFQREVGDGALQVPKPSFKSPISSDWRRAANAVSLIIQRIF